MATTKDRHRPGYYKERWQKQKAEGKQQKDRHRPGYYHEYNQKRSKRLAKAKAPVNDSNSKEEQNPNIAYLDALVRYRKHLWYDDDWCED